MEKRRDHYLGNEYSQIHYLQSLREGKGMGKGKGKVR
jgi:hypothetical protein